MTSDFKETSVTIQDVYREGMKYIENDKHHPSWAAYIGENNGQEAPTKEQVG